MSDKSPHKLTDEELLELTLQNDQKEVFNNDIILFASTFNLEIGDNKVSGKYLHQIYQAWSKAKIHQEEFFTEMNRLYPYENKNKQPFYSINLSISNLTKKVIEIAPPPKEMKRHKNTLFQEKFEKMLADNNITQGKTWTPFNVLLQLYKKIDPIESHQNIMYMCDLYFQNRFNKFNEKEYATKQLTSEVKLKENNVEEEKVSSSEESVGGNGF